MKNYIEQNNKLILVNNDWLFSNGDIDDFIFFDKYNNIESDVNKGKNIYEY